MTAGTHLRSALCARRAPDGFIVVAVLWILAALAALVSIYAIYVSNTAVALSINNDAVVADGLVSAGVELAAYRIVSAPNGDRPVAGQFAFRMGKGRVTVDFRGETARIDLNAAPKALLVGLFVALGAQPDDAEQYADRIIGWRKKPASESLDGEASLYRRAGLGYEPRGGAFAHVAELWLVLGLPPALVERALPHLTVFSGRPQINPDIAAPEVLAALPDPASGRTGSAQGTTGSSRTTTTDGSDAVRVTVRVDLDNGRRLGAEAVILVRDFGEDPFRVLSWRDDIDTQLPQPHQRARRR